jgi:putative ABC transport system substrate-binding protein
MTCVADVSVLCLSQRCGTQANPNPEQRQYAERRKGLVVVSTAGVLAVARPRILQVAASHRWPVIGGVNWPDDGALLGYGSDITATFRRAAHLADRILKGAKPADMPIERPMTFELVLNMKTAKALGLTIPHEFGVRVDRVVQ